MQKVFDLETRELPDTETRVLDGEGRIVGRMYESRMIKRSRDMKYDGGSLTDEYHTQLNSSGEITAKEHIVTIYDAQNRETQKLEYSAEDGGEILKARTDYNSTDH